MGYRYKLKDYKDILYKAQSEKNLRFFSDFAGNSRTQKPNKEQKKRANTTSIHYFCAYQQVVTTSYFILYTLFILLP